MPKAKKPTSFQPTPNLLQSKTNMILRELDDGYQRITDENDPDKYPPFALTAWDDRNRYREYVGRILARLEREGKI